MTVLEIDNRNDTTTHHWSSLMTVADQSNAVTRRVLLLTGSGEVETREIERNPTFHAVILERLSRRVGDDDLIDADGVLGDR